jgi:hypothetical protein
MKKIISFTGLAALLLIISGCVFNQNQTSKPITSQPPIEEPKNIDQNPTDTQSSFIDKNKVIKGPLTKLSLTFKTDINEKTLNNDTFYALQGLEDKIPGKISYDKTTKTGTITFTTPIEGGAPGQETLVTINALNIGDIKGNVIAPMTYSVNVVK